MLGYLFAASMSVRTDMQNASGAVRAAQNAAESALIPTEQRIDALELACAGMWELLKGKFDLTDQQLVAAITAVDARDGKVDGKMRQQLADCPNCGRQLVTRSRVRCVWCGAELPNSTLTGGSG